MARAVSIVLLVCLEQLHSMESNECEQGERAKRPKTNLWMSSWENLSRETGFVGSGGVFWLKESSFRHISFAQEENDELESSAILFER